jgi:phage shock protein PspC (stress-responsive transcriptional regulator)/predicted membrane protein
VIAGVAGGIARRLDIPAWVVRVAFVVLSFGGGLGIALYIAGWLLITDDGDTEPIARGLLGRIQDSSGWVGIAFVGLGVLIAASSIDFIRGDLAIAVFLGVIGVMLYRGEIGDRNKSETTPDDPTPATRSATYLTDDTTSASSVPPLPPPPATAQSTEPPKPPKEPRPPSILGRLTVALTLIATGVMAFFDYALETFDPSPRHYLGLALGIVGVGLLVGSVLGRARGLIFLGILIVPALTLSPLAEFDFNSGIGERRVEPATVADIQSSYDLAIGELVVDLRGVDFSGETVDLDTSVGIGSLRVLVPEGVRVEVDAEVGIGEVQVFGSVRSGFARELDTTRDGVGTLVLDAETMIGEVRVTAADGSTVNIGTINEVVTTPQQLRREYVLESGDIRLDLSNLVLDHPERVTITSGLGRIEVIVPSRATTTVNAHSDLGRITAYGTRQGGFDTTVSLDATDQVLLTLDINIDGGEIVVEEG